MAAILHIFQQEMFAACTRLASRSVLLLLESYGTIVHLCTALAGFFLKLEEQVHLISPNQLALLELEKALLYRNITLRRQGCNFDSSHILNI